MISPSKRKLLTVKEASGLCEEVERHEIKEGDKWFIVSSTWWQEFIEACETDSDKFVDVKPISNAPISLNGKNGWELKDRLVEKLNYQLIPCNVFQRLREVYGVENEDRDVIQRKVVSGTLLKYEASFDNKYFSKDPFVAVYPLELKIANYARKNDVLTIEVSPGETLENIKNLALESLKIPSDKRNTVRFYIDEDGKCEPINPSISQAKLATLLQMNTTIYIDDTGKSLDELNGNNKQLSRFANSYPSRSASKGSPGLCGLQNLGNTCFMNSALQCLSNVPELTEYFFDGKYEDDINYDNPLGTGGKLARAYGSLIKEMWSGTTSVARPMQLKMVIGQIAPRFNGYQQHDSQELLAFLLDGLHEDLNRIKKKPYVEEKEADGRPDNVVAREAWNDYLKRNDSVIVDHFHGQLKSTLVCPKCQKVSVKFDPFCFLSVPVPAKERSVKSGLLVVRKPKLAKVALTHTTKTTFNQLIEELKNQIQNLNTRIVVINVSKIFGSNYRFEKFMAPEQQIQPQYYTYGATKEFMAFPVRDGPLLVIEQMTGTTYEQVYSVPVVINYDPQNLTREFVETKILPYIREVLKKPETKKPGIESSDDETEKQPVMPSAYRVSIGSEDHQFPDDKHEPLQIEHKSDGDVKLIITWPTTNTGIEPQIEGLVEREISIGVVNKNQYTLDECISIFTNQEQLGENDSWYCPKCKEHVRAYKKLDLWKLPKILIIHLKRFQYNRWSRDKIETNILFPVRELDLKKQLANKHHEDAFYDLIAISNHMGGLGGGHYTASAMNNGRWVDFNDSSVSPDRLFNRVSIEGGMPDTLTSREAYMLVYRRTTEDNKKRRTPTKMSHDETLTSLPNRYVLRSSNAKDEPMDVDVELDE